MSSIPSSITRGIGFGADANSLHDGAERATRADAGPAHRIVGGSTGVAAGASIAAACLKRPMAQIGTSIIAGKCSAFGGLWDLGVATQNRDRRGQVLAGLGVVGSFAGMLGGCRPVRTAAAVVVGVTTVAQVGGKAFPEFGKDWGKP